MYGSTMGTLNVYTTNAAGETTKIFSEIGNHGNLWSEKSIDIPAMEGLKVIYDFIINKQ